MQENVMELFTKYRETGDVAIRNKIAEKYLYIAEILAKKFIGRGVPYDDLVQEATMYLLEAIDGFDETRGLQFSTFATPTITGKLKNYFRDHARLMKVPRKLSELNLEIRRFSEKYLSDNGVMPSIRIIATELNTPEEEIITALEIGSTVSIDSQIGGDEDGRTLGDFIPAQDNGFEALELRETLAAAMADLPEFERKIIQLRFVDELSQTETAARLNISQMTVSRAERKVLAKLKERLANIS